MKNIKALGLIIGSIVILGILIFLFKDQILRHPSTSSVDTVSPALNDFFDDQNIQNTSTSSSLVASSSITSSLTTTQDIRIDLQYEEPKYSQSAQYWPNTVGTYTDPATSEQYLLLSDKISAGGYGSQSYSIFQAVESHSYQGTPIYLSSIHNNQSLSYIGLRINDFSLINNIKVELGVDYLASQSTRRSQTGSAGGILSKILSWIATKIAEACGPGIYLRQVGDSNMTFVGTKDGVSWFKLDKEISVSDIPLSYCNSSDCYANQMIKDLSGGNLRMHIDYVPAGKSGVLKVQLANAVFHNQQDGKYSSATLGKDSSDMYRAALSEEEVGSLNLQAGTQSSSGLDLVLTNKGNAPINLNDYSFNKIKNSLAGKQAVGFVIRDINNMAVAHISFDSIVASAKGRTIGLNSKISVPLLQSNNLPAGIYTLGLEYINSNSLATVAPHLISWDFELSPIFQSNGNPLYSLYVDSNHVIGPVYALGRSGWSFVTYPSNYQSSQAIYDLNYLLPIPGYYPEFNSKTNYINQSSSRGVTVDEIRNNTGSLWANFIPNFSSAGFFSQLAVSPDSNFQDFEGNTVNVYRRGALTGYAIERDIKAFQGPASVHGVLVFEIPTVYLSDNTFSLAYILAIKSFSDRVSQ